MKEQKSISRLHRRNDIVFIIALFLISAVGILYLFVFRSSGNVIKVTAGGDLYGIYSLSEDRTEDIKTADDGQGFNRLIIKDGKAFIESASCPDGICVSHRPIFRDGESIVCLPNKVVVTVFTENYSDSPDIIG